MSTEPPNADTTKQRIRFSPEWWASRAGAWGVVLTVAAAVVAFWNSGLATVLAFAAALVGVVAWRFSTITAKKSEERAATAEHELLELKERLKDRALSDDQRARFVNALRQGTACDVSVITNRGDDEATRFAETIVRLLKEGGWKAERFTIDTHLESGTSGWLLHQAIERSPLRPHCGRRLNRLE